MYGYGFNNPLNNGFQQNLFQQPKQEVVKVNGENGARAYPMGPNSSALLLDESGKLVWLVMTDGAGYKTVTPYDITAHQQAEPINYTTLETRIARLEAMMNEHTTNTSTTRSEDSATESEFITTKKFNERSAKRQ